MRDRFDHARVVDQNVQTTEGLDAVFDGLLDLPVARDIAGNRNGVFADFTSQISNLVRATRNQGHFCTGIGEFPRGGCADSAAGTRDQNHFSRQIHANSFQL